MKILLLLLFICSAKPLFAKEEVKLYLKWKFSFQFAGFLMAKEKGFYEKLGLDVEFVEKEIGWTTQQKVGNKIGHYGITDSTIVIDYLAGSPLLIVAPIFQHSPLVLLALRESQIFSPRDLLGKKIMYQKGSDDAVFIFMLENVGVKESDVQQIPHSMNIQDLIDKNVDAMSVYGSNQPLILESKGIEHTIIDPRNYGVDFYGDILFTNTNEANHNPKRVRAMRKASLKGWEYAFSNPEETAKILKEKYNVSKSIESLLREGQVLRRFAGIDSTKLGTLHIPRLVGIANYYKRSIDKPYELLKFLSFDQYIKSDFTLDNKNLKIIFGIMLIILLAFFISILFNKRLKYEVDVKAKELEENQALKEIIFASLTHDLRTPLNGISSALELYMNTNDENKRLEYISIVQLSTKTLIELVNHILQFSKMEQKKAVFANTDVNIFEHIDEIIPLFKVLSSNKKIKFQPYLSLTRDLCIKADEVKITQLLTNIISNAIKYTEEGSVQFDVFEEDLGDKVKISFSVTDSGEGLPEDELKVIFHPFQRARSNTNTVQGTGLGLSISQKIVEYYGGEISAENISPHGLKISFDMIFKKGKFEDKKSKILDRRLDKIDLGKKRILLVEDDLINALLITRFLESYNATIVWMKDGRKALEEYQNNHFDMIITDRNMPYMGGAELTENIRSMKDPLKANVFIVGFSANWENGFDEECINCQMNASISKPINHNYLRKILSEFLDVKKVA